MGYLRNIMCLLLTVLLLVQTVFAASVPDDTQPPEPDIISAVYTAASVPANWSPLSSSAAEAQWLRKMTTAPVYALSGDGIWEPVLARALPEDVTADYAASYGIPAGAAGGYAYRIALNPDARWEDGLVITADDYVFSIQKLLENEENCADWTFLANAEAILSGKKQPSETIVSLRQAGFYSIADAVDAGFQDFYIDIDGFWGLEGGWCSITDRRGLQDFAMPAGMDERVVSPAYLYTNYLASGKESAHYQRYFIGIPEGYGDALTMADLGVVKVSPFELVLILQEPMAPSTLMQKLENLFLFRQSLWSKDFATSLETYCGYGPYRITEAASGRIVLEPNENWWGEPVSGDFDRIICRAGQS